MIVKYPLLVIGFAVSLCSTSLFAQQPAAPPADENSLTAPEPTGPSQPTPRTPDGHPDFNGYWKGDRKMKPVGNIGKDLPGYKLPLTAAGQAALQHNLTQTVDPESLCIIGGIPRHDASALPFMVLQTPKYVAFLYLYTYYRLIPTDGRKHSEDPDPSFFGEEIGRWEGDTLVVDSIAFKGERVWIDENANPHSDNMHVDRVQRGESVDRRECQPA